MSPPNLLLVDDEKQFIETLAKRLRQRGFVSNCVYSGMQALDYLEKDSSIDIVLLDIRMPGLDGVKIIEKIKEKHPLVEVIMLTGYAEVQSAVDALKFGAFDYLAKPCDLKDLISKAEQAAVRKKDRETRILNLRMQPYISDRERAEQISKILDS